MKALRQSAASVLVHGDTICVLIGRVLSNHRERTRIPSRCLQSGVPHRSCAGSRIFKPLRRRLLGIGLNFGELSELNL